MIFLRLNVGGTMSRIYQVNSISDTLLLFTLIITAFTTLLTSPARRMLRHVIFDRISIVAHPTTNSSSKIWLSCPSDTPVANYKAYKSYIREHVISSRQHYIVKDTQVQRTGRAREPQPKRFSTPSLPAFSLPR